MLAGACFDSDTIFPKHFGDIGGVLGDAVPVADVVEPASSASLVAHKGHLVYQRAHAKPGTALAAVVKDYVLPESEPEVLFRERFSSEAS